MNIKWFKNVDIKHFPDSAMSLTEPDGLLAVGGNLSVATLTLAYSQGVFPWFEDGQQILWWCPSQRAVINTNDIHVSKNMRKLIKQQKYTIALDKNFPEIIKMCRAITIDRQETWITNDIEAAYLRLFNEGIAHSVEVYRNDKIIGGLYGVFIANCFCGESMYSREPNASKLALIELANILKKNGCNMIDCQLPTPHLLSMGAKIIPRVEFIEEIKNMSDNLKMQNKRWSDICQQ